MSEAENNNTRHIEKLFEKFEQMQLSVNTLQITTEQGFQGVHDRQDTTNGRITALENDFEDIDDRQKETAKTVGQLAGIHADEEESLARTAAQNDSDRRFFRRKAWDVVFKVIATILLGLITLFMGYLAWKIGIPGELLALKQ